MCRTELLFKIHDLGNCCPLKDEDLKDGLLSEVGRHDPVVVEKLGTRTCSVRVDPTSWRDRTASGRSRRNRDSKRHPNPLVWKDRA